MPTNARNFSYKYSKIILTLTPELSIWNNDDYDIYSIEYVEHPYYKLLINRLKRDYVNIESIFSYLQDEYNNLIEWNTTYYYDVNNGKITITMTKKSGDFITNQSKIVENLHQYIDEDGPDTWMEGDLSIFKETDFNTKTSYKLKKELLSIEINIGIDKIQFI